MSYPVSGMVRDYVPDGYPAGHPIVPHGMAVCLNAPAVFRFTGPANPEVHLYCAELMGVDGERGTIEPGKDADLVLLDGDPFDFAGYRDRIAAVYQLGKLVSGGV